MAVGLWGWWGVSVVGWSCWRVPVVWCRGGGCGRGERRPGVRGVGVAGRGRKLRGGGCGSVLVELEHVAGEVYERPLAADRA